jgi:hypothetical protein
MAKLAALFEPDAVKPAYGWNRLRWGVIGLAVGLPIGFVIGCVVGGQGKVSIGQNTMPPVPHILMAGSKVSCRT